jgi:predicted enzyme related to lactoylglutathione lyase
MANQVVWFDVPVTDIDRAVKFYSAVLGQPLKKEECGPGMSLAVLPHEGKDVGGCLTQGPESKPSASGPLLYFNCQGRLDEAIGRVESHGGRIVKPKHAIGPYGFCAHVLDSEGNRIALHSM